MRRHDPDACVLDALVRPELGHGPLPHPPIGRLAAFSDDLLRGGHRHAVRAVLRDVGTRWHVDLRDSSPICEGAPAIGIDDARLAALLAFGDALGLPTPDARLAEWIELELDARTWVGTTTPAPGIARAFGIARVFDAVLGALALAWPDRSRAGSCSLGAIVVLDDGEGVDVVAGGRGADVHGNGASGWPGWLLPRRMLRCDEHVSARVTARPESGGGGARVGGDGQVARYHFHRDGAVLVALDRISNPPHGLDRAGPPSPAYAARIAPDGSSTPLAAWQRHAVHAGDIVEVATAGGAGHGFPGWGIEFDWEP